MIPGEKDGLPLADKLTESIRRVLCQALTCRCKTVSAQSECALIAVMVATVVRRKGKVK